MKSLEEKLAALCSEQKAAPGQKDWRRTFGMSVNDSHFEEMIQLDSEYVRNQSLWLDTKILSLTIPTVLSGRGAE